MAYYIDNGNGTATMQAGSIDYVATIQHVLKIPGLSAWNTDKPLGVDVSTYQKLINWDAMKAAGVKFAIIRSSIGLNMDANFASNWNGAAKVGIIRGAYHALFPGLDIGGQIAIVKKALGDDKGELPPTLDVERVDGVAQSSISLRAQKWLGDIADWYDGTPILYSSVNYLNLCFGAAPAWVNDYHLWLAQYLYANPITGMAAEHPGPVTLPSWIQRERVLIHQTAGKGDAAGFGVQSKNLDFNRWQFDLAHLAQFANIENVPPPLTIEERVANLEDRVSSLETGQWREG